MKRHILSLTMLTLAIMAAPIYNQTTAKAAIDIVDIDEKEPVIRYTGKTIHIDNAQGETLCIYDIRGVMIQTYKITSPSQRIDINNLPKGCYLVKVGKSTVRKISVK